MTEEVNDGRFSAVVASVRAPVPGPIELGPVFDRELHGWGARSALPLSLAHSPGRLRHLFALLSDRCRLRKGVAFQDGPGDACVASFVAPALLGAEHHLNAVLAVRIGRATLAVLRRG